VAADEWQHSLGSPLIKLTPKGVVFSFLSGNIRQLSELGCSQMPTPQGGTKSQLVWLHEMLHVKLAMATLPWQASN